MIYVKRNEIGMTHWVLRNREYIQNKQNIMVYCRIFSVSPICNIFNMSAPWCWLLEWVKYKQLILQKRMYVRGSLSDHGYSQILKSFTDTIHVFRMFSYFSRSKTDNRCCFWYTWFFFYNFFLLVYNKYKIPLLKNIHMSKAFEIDSWGNLHLFFFTIQHPIWTKNLINFFPIL